MKKGLSIRRQDGFKIYWNNRQLYAYYHHYIWHYRIDEYHNNPCFSNYRIEPITEDNIADCIIGDGFESLFRLKNLIEKQSKFVNGFLFYNNSSGDPVSFIWIMYPGGNQFQYKVRHASAYVFNVFVNESNRGKGIFSIMMDHVQNYLLSKGIYDITSAVRTNNSSSNIAYRKYGFNLISERRFIKIMRRYNLPYYSI